MVHSRGFYFLALSAALLGPAYGDLCNCQEAANACGTFTVQKEWSNSAHACVSQ